MRMSISILPQEDATFSATSRRAPSGHATGHAQFRGMHMQLKSWSRL